MTSAFRAAAIFSSSHQSLVFSRKNIGFQNKRQVHAPRNKSSRQKLENRDEQGESRIPAAAARANTTPRLVNSRLGSRFAERRIVDRCTPRKLIPCTPAGEAACGRAHRVICAQVRITAQRVHRSFLRLERARGEFGDEGIPAGDRPGRLVAETARFLPALSGCRPRYSHSGSFCSTV